MRQKLFVLICLFGCCCAGPLAAYQKRNMPIAAREDTAMATAASSMEEAEVTAEESAPKMPAPGTLTLPSNATSIRADITDNFSCDNKTYGYYADVENDCQIFHVCLPVTYADGKENIFRWSFICPEETIFSQESFTCMRPEDMTIRCDESFRYYELNNNFGGIEEEEESVRPSSNQVASVDQMQSESVVVVDQRPSESEQPQQPAMVKPKPVKVQKPIRRKPAVSYTNQKKDVPLRKMPQVAPTKTAEEMPAVEEPIAVAATQTVNEVEVKPAPQRFNKRPVNVSPANKEKPQAANAETTAMRVELFNQKRKRPTYMNKKEAAPTTPKTVSEAEPAVESLATKATQIELNEPMPTLRLQTMFGKPQEVVEPAEPQLTQDAVAEASEPVGAVVQLDEAIKTAAAEEAQHEKTEVVKVESTVKTHQKPTEAETPAVPVETIKAEPEKVQAPVEAYEEIPAVVVEVEEPKPEVIEQAPEKTEQQALKSEIIAPQTAAVEEVAVPLKVTEIEEAPVEAVESAPAVPATFTPSNSAEALNNVEAMEAEKPADAPESMPATPEMEQHSPVVEEMLGNDDDRQHETLGGFKPVDPEMAAEAEQLIADFINTLRLNENNDVPNMVHAETIEPVAAEEQTKLVEALEAVGETQPAAEATNEREVFVAAPELAENVSIEEAKLPDEPQIVDPNVSVEEQLTKDVSENEPQLLKNAAPISSMLMLHNLPADLYQIPVKVIEAPEEAEVAPFEAMPQEEDVLVPAIQEDEPQASVEVQKDEAEAAPQQDDEVKQVDEPMASAEPVAEEAELAGQPADNEYAAPISIDDIIELVKERLDQTPKNEQPQPMELVLTSGSDEAAPAKMTLKTISEETPSNADQDAPKTEEAEDIVVPIYQRQTETKVETAEQASQTEDEPALEQAKVVEESAEVEAAAVEAAPEPVATETKPKMDARKRRFLFRADA